MHTYIVMTAERVENNYCSRLLPHSWKFAFELRPYVCVCVDVGCRTFAQGNKMGGVDAFFKTISNEISRALLKLIKNFYERFQIII